MRPAPGTFDTKLDAGAWLKAQTGEVDRGTWEAPQPITAPSGTTLRTFAASWLDQRELKPRTRAEYQRLLDALILPDLGDVRLDRLTPTTVRTWYASLDPAKPTRRAHAYALLRTVLTTAVADDLITANPCRIRGAGSTKSKHETQVASLAELEVIVERMPERFRALVLLAAWVGLRFGELTELRRGDLDLEARVVRVRRGVTRTAGTFHVLDPKSEAGKRTVTIPPHLVPLLEQHLAEHVDRSPGALLFPARHGGHLSASTLQEPWGRAREAAGRPDLRFHDLRHTGATLAAATGATLADLMARMGHSTPAAALRYQHAVADRDRAISEALSGFAEGQVIPLRPVAGSKT